MPAHANPSQQWAVADSTSAENDVFAARQVRRVEDAVQLLFQAQSNYVLILFVIARPHHRLKIPSEAPDCRGREDSLRSPPNTDIEIYTAFRDRWRDRGGNISIRNHSNHRAGRTDCV